MAIAQVVTLSLGAAAANAIALSQTPGAAGNLTLNGAAAANGVATLDVGRRVLITSAGDDSTAIFTITGTNQTGNPISETLFGGNAAAVQSQRDYKTVIRVAISKGAAGAVTVGTSTVGSSPWKNISYNFGPMSLSIGCVVQGTVDATIEYTYDNLNNDAAPNSPPIPTPWPHPILRDFTANIDGTLGPAPITGWRLTINTGSGQVTATGLAAGIINQR